MEDKKILSSEELEKVTGGIEVGPEPTFSYSMSYRDCPKCGTHVSKSNTEPIKEGIILHGFDPDEARHFFPEVYCAKCGYEVGSAIFIWEKS